MSVFSRHFPLGLGTARFPISGPTDTVGFEKSVEMVTHALMRGMDYVDVGYNYSAGMAPAILKEAFSRINTPFSVTAKVQYGEDKTADDARRRVEMHLKALGLDNAEYFTCWCIWNYQDFEQIMKKGGIYEGALKLKEEGVIRHICCSMHAPAEDMIKILRSGVFEGATVSYSLLNATQMQPVLDTALEKEVGIAVMNPLGGGIIAQNKDFFSYACADEDRGNVIHAALRFAKAHPAVDIVLGGVSSKKELDDSLEIFTKENSEPKENRMKRVMEQTSSLQGFCTGCKYCKGCPKGVPTYSIMQAYNALLFRPVESYNRQGPEELLYNLQLFRKLYMDEGWVPETAENPCVACGQCIQKCTQKLDIIECVEDVYQRVAKTGYSKEAHTGRLKELLVGKGYRRVGLYPSSVFAKRIMQLWKEADLDSDFEWVLFNSDSKMWGKEFEGLTIHGPHEIEGLQPDIILISTYRFDNEIETDLQEYRDKLGIVVEKIHKENEVPWAF